MNVDDEQEEYSLTAQGLILMSTVLARAVKLQLINIRDVNDANIQDYVEVIASHSELWEGTPITEYEQKLVLITMTLLRLITPTDAATSN